MKREFLIAIVISLALFVLPAIAGEGHGHGEEAAYKKCSADAQSCLNWFADKYKNRGWAGVSLEMSDAGLRVSEVHPGTPAAGAGVQVGDVLVAINGVEYKPENQDKMAEFEEQMVPGGEFTYTISRNGTTKDIGFALAEMPMDVVARMVGMHMLNDHAAVEVASADD
jgi:C-terminal processing protease CtpA/Prc